MRILLDTSILLWSQFEPGRLGAVLVDLLEDPANDILFSVASIWEIAIKASLGRADFNVSPGGEITPHSVLAAARDSDFIELPIGSAAALAAGALPPYQRDPFDRLIVAQAMSEPAMLYTSDRQLAVYSPLVLLV